MNDIHAKMYGPFWAHVRKHINTQINFEILNQVGRQATLQVDRDMWTNVSTKVREQVWNQGGFCVLEQMIEDAAK